MPNRIIQYPVPLIFKKIFKDQSDGELVVAGNNFVKHLFFIKGKLIFASSNLNDERLGDILFKIGKITQIQYAQIEAILDSSEEHVGRSLLDQNVISEKDLYFALVYRARAIATSTFSMVSGEWNFVQKMPVLSENCNLNIGLAGIIVEGANKIANISYFKNKYFYKASRFFPIPGGVEEFLSPHEVQFYNTFSRFGNLSLEHVMEQMKVPEEIFWKKIILFYLLNVIDFCDVVVDKDRDKNIEEITLIYDQLQANRMDYYQLLGVKNTAALDEIKRMYFQYARKYHPDRVSSSPDPDIKEKANVVFAEINKAYDTLSSPDKKKEYDIAIYRENTQALMGHESAIERARVLYRKSKLLYGQKQYTESLTLVEEAAGLDPTKASYFLLLGLCQMNIPKFRRVAVDNLQKAIDLEPWNVEAYAAMGLLYMSEGQSNRAETFFRKALSINPEHALAKKKLDEITRADDKKKNIFNIFGKSKK
ncbi:MAG: J domain-containing protein [Candidatus Omnitrophota bacterium]